MVVQLDFGHHMPYNTQLSPARLETSGDAPNRRRTERKGTAVVIETISIHGVECLTPAELREWRLSLDWSTRRAADELGVSERTYKYLEQGSTSAGKLRPEIPRHIELAVAELTRRERK